MCDWLIIYCFTSHREYFTHQCWWRAAKFRPMLGTQGLWAGRDLHRATPAVTRDLGFSGLIRMTAPFSRLLRHARGCRGPILTQVHEIEGKSRYFRKIIAWTEKKNSEEGITNSDIQKKRDIVNSKRWCSANEQIQPTFLTKTISISIVHPYWHLR